MRFTAERRKVSLEKEVFALCLCEKPPQAKALAVPPLQLATCERQ